MKRSLSGLLEVFDLKRFAKFGLIGVLNTLVDLGVFWLMDRIIGDGPRVVLLGTAVLAGPYISNLISYLAGNINSFLWNRFWTFEKKGSISGRELGRYLVTSLGYVVLSTLCLAVFMELLEGRAAAEHVPMLAKVPTICVTMVYNYLLNKLWVFR